jgi:glycosyltransferase involved in cell wall biosynthesis
MRPTSAKAALLNFMSHVTTTTHTAGKPVRREQDESGDVDLTVLMPCLNEAETIATCIAKATSFFARVGVRGEVLVADNGSTDGSQARASAKGARVLSVRERGYGAALRAGIRAARSPYVILGDADDSYDFSQLDDFWSNLRAGHDLVMGNRFRGGVAPGAMSLLHHVGNRALSFVGRQFFAANVGDFHCGLRGVNRDRITALGLYSSGMEYASEMVIGAVLRHYNIVEVSTTFGKAGRSRPPHLRTWRDGWRHLRLMLLLSPRWLFVYPGLLLMLAGTGVAAALLPGPVVIAHRLTLDIRTLLVAAAVILLGVQSISFGIVARRFAAKYRILPEPERFAGSLAAVTVGRGLVLAGFVTVGGLAGLAWSLARWGMVGFGPLDDSLVTRVLVLSLTALVAAVQLAFTSFLLGVIDLLAKRDESCLDAPARGAYNDDADEN